MEESQANIALELAVARPPGVTAHGSPSEPLQLTYLKAIPTARHIFPVSPSPHIWELKSVNKQ